MTWQIAATPSTGVGSITSISMKDVNIGYASVYSTDFNKNDYNLWKTTDGGATWSDNTFEKLGTVTCVYATSAALIETVWDYEYLHSGGRSVDDALSFKQFFLEPGNTRSNGIDFSDDLNGVVVMGPNTSKNPNATLGCWFTQDGGVNWDLGDQVPEAWSVYAVKGTQTYFALPEGVAEATNRTVYRTDDGGRNWRTIFTFPNSPRPNFTGHIAGQGTTLYAQTEGAPYLGLYRSDDLGKNWKNIGGPTNHRDTRFVVTGCKGEVVYAFDTLGGVWKTADGGDGTLSGLANNEVLSLGADSLFISSACIPARGFIHLTNLNCLEYIFDSINFTPDPYNEFSLDTTRASFSLFSNMSAGLPVKFQTDSNVTRITHIHVHGHYGSTPFDTTITLVARHTTFNDPLFAFGVDTLAISGNCAIPARAYLNVINRNCDSITIDTIGISPDPYGEFSVDTVKNGFRLFADASVGIPILFRSDSDVTRATTIHIHIHAKNRIVDTTITIVASHSTTSGPILGLSYDSLYMESRYCQPVRRYIDLSNVNCNDLIIDSVSFDPQYPEFTIDSTQRKNLSLVSLTSVSIPILYQTDSNLTRRSTMHIVAHSLGRMIDTTIILVAKHSKAPEPFLVNPADAKVGEIILVPVFLRPTQDSFRITHYAFHLSYDGDILTPSNPQFEVRGTLSSRGTVTMGVSEVGGVLCTVDLPKPITQDSNLLLPLIYLRMNVTLSRNYSTPITMNSFSNSAIATEPLCSTPVSEFTIIPECGDSTLVGFMLTGKLPGIVSVHPNPNSGGDVEAVIYLPTQNTLTIELVDAMGKRIQSVCSSAPFPGGEHTLRINTDALPNGSYILRLRSAEGHIARRAIVILH